MNLRQVETEAVLLGGARRLAASATGHPDHWRTALLGARPVHRSCNSNHAARLAHAAKSKSDGEAEARLNVKGFNMGENSPWLTLIEGSDSGRPSRSTLFSCRSSMASDASARSSRDQRPCGLLSPNRCHQFGTPVSSPWHDLGEPVGFIVIRSPPLNALHVLYQHFTAAIRAGRHGRAKREICTKRTAHTIRVSLLFGMSNFP